jgi:hypothetical protein
MARDTSSLQEAKMLLEVLKRIPLNRKISTTDLHQQLTAAGFELSRRTLQRYLKALSESDMGVQCDDKSKPFGYRRLLNSNDLDRVGLGADGALLLLLAREHLRYQMPPDLTNSLSYLFDAAENYMHTASGSSPEKRWLSKVRFVSGSLPLCPPMILRYLIRFPRAYLNKSNSISFISKVRTKKRFSCGYLRWDWFSRMSDCI